MADVNMLAVVFVAMSNFAIAIGQMSECMGNYSIYNQLHTRRVDTLTGNRTSLSKYKGYVGQFFNFNKLATQLGDRGFRVVLFPCNQFKLQEPGRNSEILAGYKYVRPKWEPAENVDVYGKIKVNGRRAHPLYKMLKTLCFTPSPFMGDRRKLYWDELDANDVKWNYEKFLIDRNGVPRYRFLTRYWSEGKAVMPFIEELLSEI